LIASSLDGRFDSNRFRIFRLKIICLLGFGGIPALMRGRTRESRVISATLPQGRCAGPHFQGLGLLRRILLSVFIVARVGHESVLLSNQGMGQVAVLQQNTQTRF
jgi:hypothetical protein